jgi:formamidopyrimidine-DNA glycosylase
MPELPEVETIKRQIEERFADKFLSNYHNTDNSSIDISSELTGVHRCGKNIILRTSSKTVVINLGMTGRLLTPEFSHSLTHKRGAFHFTDDILLYDDIRKFGRIKFVNKHSKRGLDPLNDELTADKIKTLYNSRKPVKQLLMEQNLISGIGNIYASEILFKSAIHPLKKGCELEMDELIRLINSIDKTLNSAIKNGGTTLRNFTDIYNRPGKNQNYLHIYGKDSCGRCGSEVTKIKVYSRSTFFCPNCQQETNEYNN